MSKKIIKAVAETQEDGGNLLESDDSSTNGMELMDRDDEMASSDHEFMTGEVVLTNLAGEWHKATVLDEETDSFFETRYIVKIHSTGASVLIGPSSLEKFKSSHDANERKKVSSFSERKLSSSSKRKQVPSSSEWKKVRSSSSSSSERKLPSSSEWKKVRSFSYSERKLPSSSSSSSEWKKVRSASSERKLPPPPSSSEWKKVRSASDGKMRSSSSSEERKKACPPLSSKRKMRSLHSESYEEKKQKSSNAGKKNQLVGATSRTNEEAVGYDDSDEESAKAEHLDRSARASSRRSERLKNCDAASVTNKSSDAKRRNKINKKSDVPDAADVAKVDESYKEIKKRFFVPWNAAPKNPEFYKTIEYVGSKGKKSWAETRDAECCFCTECMVKVQFHHGYYKAIKAHYMEKHADPNEIPKKKADAVGKKKDQTKKVNKDFSHVELKSELEELKKASREEKVKLEQQIEELKTSKKELEEKLSSIEKSIEQGSIRQQNDEPVDRRHRNRSKSITSDPSVTSGLRSKKKHRSSSSRPKSRSSRSHDRGSRRSRSRDRQRHRSRSSDSQRHQSRGRQRHRSRSHDRQRPRSRSHDRQHRRSRSHDRPSHRFPSNDRQRRSSSHERRSNDRQRHRSSSHERRAHRSSHDRHRRHDRHRHRTQHSRSKSL
jgi:hypothetical protein